MHTIAELKVRLVKEEKHLEGCNGETCLMGPAGPISLGLAKAIISVLEEQGREIEVLKAKIAEK